MTRLNRLASLLAVVATLSTQTAHAQGGTTTFNIAAGLSLPTGDFGNRNETGYNIVGGIGTMQRGTAYGFRAEAFYNEFNQKGTGVSGTSHAGGATFNLVYDFIPPATNQPYSLYGIGGIGYYSTRESWYNTDAETNFGWNVGAGLRFPLSGFSAYVEARYHSVSSSLNVTFLPISFGLQF